MDNKKLLIIDGSSLLSTSFYGTCGAYLMAKTDEAKELALSKLLKTSDGRYTNGVYTFMKTLLSLIQNQRPTHLAIVWDVSRASFRRSTINAEYKGTRKETPAPLKEQFKTTQTLLQDIFPQYMSKIDDLTIYEADDFAGSIAKRFETQLPVYLYTKDQDYLQLISEYTRVWLVTSKCDEMLKEMGINPKEFHLPSGAFEYTLETLKHFEGLEPYQIVEYKSIVGDTSDNIKGVAGVGPKAALPLLQEYGNIETIYSMIEGLSDKEEKELAKFFKESLGISRSPIKGLLAGKDSAFESKQLATIKTDIPEIQELNLEDLEIKIDYKKLEERLISLEMNSLVSSLKTNQQVDTSISPAHIATDKVPSTTISSNDIDDFINGEFYPSEQQTVSKEEQQEPSKLNTVSTQISLF